MLQEADEGVYREGRKLKAQVDRKEVSARGHDHHAAERKEHEHIVLTHIYLLGLEIPEGDEYGEDRNYVEYELEEGRVVVRSEEHTSELQPQSNLVCRL